MPDDPATRARQRMQALRSSFREHLDEMVTRVAQDWRDLHTGADQATILDGFRELYAAAHRITGSAGSFGYRSVSEAAAPLEVLLGRVREVDAPPGREIWDQIGLYVSHLADSWSAQRERDPDSLGEARGLCRPAFDPGLLYALGDAAEIATLANRLAPFGYRLESFRDPLTLAGACRQEPPGVVLWLDSLEALAALADLPESVPVLMLAEQPDMPRRLAAVRAGCQGYLTRPVELGDLVVWLEQLSRRGTQPAEPYRVLIVDDDEHLAESYRLVLQMAGLWASVLSEPLRILEVLVTDNPDLILMDMQMPDCSGMELVQVIRQHLNYLGIPIVFLSAEDDRERQLGARIVGADDFLPKPVSAPQLVRMVSNRAERSRALRLALRQDSLTGLLNPVGLKERLTVELLRAQRQSTPLSLALLDLDRFRDFNERHGHYQGDQVLRALTRLLARRLRRTDIIGRNGGGEFAIILPDTAAPAASRVIDELRGMLACLDFTGEVGADEPLTLSAGIADNRADAGPEALLAAARQALRQAKLAGRDRVVSNHVTGDVQR